VAWNDYDGYVGWSPLMAYGYYAPSYVYVEREHFYDRDVNRYAVPRVVHHAASSSSGGVTHRAPTSSPPSAAPNSRRDHRLSPVNPRQAPPPSAHNIARPRGFAGTVPFTRPERVAPRASPQPPVAAAPSSSPSWARPHASS